MRNQKNQHLKTTRLLETSSKNIFQVFFIALNTLLIDQIEQLIVQYMKNRQTFVKNRFEDYIELAGDFNHVFDPSICNLEQLKFIDYKESY